MKQFQLQPTLKWDILVSYGSFFGWGISLPKLSTYGPDRKDWMLTLYLPFAQIQICYDPVIPTQGWDGRYDLVYDLFTGEYLESICRCEPGTCEFTDAYIKAGEPTRVEGKDSWAVSLEKVLRKVL
jgi:hypothetical protein